MHTPETRTPTQGPTGGAVQRHIRGLAEGITPTQLCDETLSHLRPIGEISKVAADPYDPDIHPTLLRRLEAERIRTNQITNAVEAHLQGRANNVVAELAADQTTTWTELSSRMSEEQPDAWELARQEFPDHPDEVIDSAARILEVPTTSVVGYNTGWHGGLLLRSLGASV